MASKESQTGSFVVQEMPGVVSQRRRLFDGRRGGLGVEEAGAVEQHLIWKGRIKV